MSRMATVIESSPAFKKGPAFKASPAFMGSPVLARASPVVAPDSPFGRSGILSPTYRGFVPPEIAPLVTLESPSQGKAFQAFAEATPRRDSPRVRKVPTGVKIEMKPLSLKQM